jgi:threonine aldolase
MMCFDSDYLEGAHPKLLEKILSTNFIQTMGYGEDEFCLKAAELIKRECHDTDIDVHFLTGGTVTNLTLIASSLRPHQAVISAHTGHINVHESGAIEATGHKVLGIDSSDGKITVSQIRRQVEIHRNDPAKEHAVQPKMVYISNPTEVGTIYTRCEMEEMAEYCRAQELLLYMDGARLAYALTAEGNDLSFELINSFCDAFYIGGTKVGALFGEALVIRNKTIQEDFRYIIKQKGGLLAKGRLLGIQFQELFRDGLYFEIGKHANCCARIIQSALVEKQYPFLANHPTNLLFPIIPHDHLERLQTKYSFSDWGRYDDQNRIIRICTSWATTRSAAMLLASDIIAL